MASLEPGKRVANRYVLMARLGDGGHAEVWAARDERGGEQVALKFMHLRNFSAGEATLILRHEAQMAQRLEHGGVLRVDEPLRDGWLVFLPMEYAGGGDAAQLRGASWRETLPVLLQVARVLEHAHSRGVVHRDIKPGNILFDDAGNVRVSDFGTASRMGSTVAMAAGSPFSASPQQLRGDAASPADDVYGLGALAYDLLSRRPPFYPDFDLQRVMREDPPPPVPVREAPAALVELVQTMLSRDPHKRPSLGQVMLALEDLRNQAAVEATQALPVARKQGRQVMTVLWFASGAAIASVFFLLAPQLFPPQDEPPVAADIATPAASAATEQLRGEVMESSELWNEAVAHYTQLLERDPALQFAMDGLARSNRRLALDRELAGYIAAPALLSVPAVRTAAERAMARGEASIPRTPRLSRQLAQLKAQLQPPGKP